jgi:hypothetical protein
MEQLNEIIEHQIYPNRGAREIQEQKKDGKEVLNEDTGSSVLHTVLNAFNNAFEPKFLNQAVRLYDSRPIRQSKDY